MRISKPSIKTDKIIAYVGLLWFFVSVDSFIAWNPLNNAVKVIVFLLVSLSTFYLSIKRKLILNRYKTIVALGALCFWCYICYARFNGPLSVILRLSDTLPFIFIATWSYKYLESIYYDIRKICIIFCIFSTILVILSFINITSFIPHIVLDARSALHERLGYVYYFYGVGLLIFETHTGQIMSRLCGFLQEPGHFAILVGFLFLSESILNIKHNKWIIIGGILTFSSNFIILALVGLVIEGKIRLKYFRYLIIGIIGLVIIFLNLSTELQDRIVYLAYERNLGTVIETLQRTGSLQEALDERINQTGVLYYDKFIRTGNILFGARIFDEDVILSDYRGMILQIGLIGLLLSLILAFSISCKKGFPYKLPLLVFFLLIYIHRAWMLYNPYLYFLAFLAVTMFCYKKKNQSLKWPIQ